MSGLESPKRYFPLQALCDLKKSYLFNELEAETGLVMKKFWVLLLLLAGL